MNMFDAATTLKIETENKSRKGMSVQRDKIRLPFFKGNYRSKKHTYSVDCKSVKVKGTRQKKVAVPVVGVTGAFLISYFACLARDIVTCENKYRINHNELAIRYDSELKELVPFTTYLVEVLMSQEGFSFADYSQGATKGAKRIEQHLRAISDREDMHLVIDSNSLITGLTKEITDSVLQSV